MKRVTMIVDRFLPDYRLADYLDYLRDTIPPTQLGRLRSRGACKFMAREPRDGGVVVTAIRVTDISEEKSRRAAERAGDGAGT